MDKIIDLIKKYNADEKLKAYKKIKATLPKALKDKYEVSQALYNFINAVITNSDEYDEIKEVDNNEKLTNLFQELSKIDLTYMIRDLLELTDKDKEYCSKLAKAITDNIDEYTIETYVVILVSYYVQKYGVYKKLSLNNVLNQYAESINAMKLIFQYKGKFYEVFADLKNNCLDYIEPENVDIEKYSTKVTFLPDIYSNQTCPSFNDYLDISHNEKIIIDTVHEGVLGVDALRSAYYSEYDFTEITNSEVSELVNKNPSVLVERYAKLAIGKTFERCIPLLDKYQINILYDKFTKSYMGLLKDKEFIFKYDKSWYKVYSNNEKMIFEILPLNINCEVINQSSCDEDDDVVDEYDEYDEYYEDDKYITWYPSVFNLCDKNEDIHELAVMMYAKEYWWVHCC